MLYVYFNFKIIINWHIFFIGLFFLFSFYLSGFIILYNHTFKDKITIDMPALILFSLYWIVSCLNFMPSDGKKIDLNYREYFGIDSKNKTNDYASTAIEKIILVATLVTYLVVTLTKTYDFNQWLDLLFIITGNTITGIVLPFIIFYYFQKYGIDLFQNLISKDYSNFFIFLLFLFFVFCLSTIIFLFSIQIGLYLSPISASLI